MVKEIADVFVNVAVPGRELRVVRCARPQEAPEFVAYTPEFLFVVGDSCDKRCIVCVKVSSSTSCYLLERPHRTRALAVKLICHGVIVGCRRSCHFTGWCCACYGSGDALVHTNERSSSPGFGKPPVATTDAGSANVGFVSQVNINRSAKTGDTAAYQLGEHTPTVGKPEHSRKWDEKIAGLRKEEERLVEDHCPRINGFEGRLGFWVLRF